MTGSDPGRGGGGDGVLAAGYLLLRVVSVLVPSGRRRHWLEEWRGELFELRRGGAGALHALVFLAGAIRHGMWERKEEWTVDSLRQDLGFAIRTLKRSPGFTLAAVLMLALGIGSSTALYSVLEVAILRPPPYPEPDRLVMVDISRSEREDGGSATEDVFPWSYPKFQVVKENIDRIEPLVGYWGSEVTLTGAGAATVVGAEVVGPGYFEMLGVRPLLGRLFLAEDDAPGAPGLITVLGYGFWRGRFGADPGIVGKTVTLNGFEVEVVGVLPEGFSGLTGTARLWIPFHALPTLAHPRRLEMTWAHFFSAVGRLAPGATVASVQPEADVAAQAMNEAFPDTDSPSTEWGVMITPLEEARVNPVARASVIALSAAVVLLLVIACANVAALLLARGTERQQEAALRAALGAGRGRLVRQLLTESLVISLAGGVVGLVVAWFGIDLLAVALSEAIGTTGSRGLEYVDPELLSLDGSVAAFALVLAVVTGLLFGVWPALKGSRPDIVGAIKESATGLGADGSARGVLGARNVLVVGQIAVALMLLVGAGLMLGSLKRLQDVPVGFDTADMLTVSYWVGRNDAARDDPSAFHAAFMERIRGLPGVQDVTLGCPPLSGYCSITSVVAIEGRPEGGGELGFIGAHAVGDDHFRVLGANLVKGRDFRPSDREGAPLVMILNQTAARELFPQGEAVGQRMKIGMGAFHDEFAEVVGVVEDILFTSPDEGPMPDAFLPFRQIGLAGTTLMIRTEGDPAALTPQLRQVAAELNPTLALSDVSTMEQRAADLTARTRVLSTLLAVFAAAALGLAAAGVWGVIAFSVAQRTRELGLRVALGAARGDLLRLVLVQVAVMAALGLGIGLGGAFLALPLLEGLLLEGTASDPRIWTAVAATLLAVSGGAAYLPARRATGVDPMVALRGE